MEGLSIAERRELKARADVRAAMVDAWHEHREFSVIDKHLPRLNVGLGTWRKKTHPLQMQGRQQA